MYLTWSSAKCWTFCKGFNNLKMPRHWRADPSRTWKSFFMKNHHNGVIMSAMASQITGISIVCSTVGSGGDQRKCQSSASLAFVRGIQRSPVNSPHKGSVTRKIKMFPLMTSSCSGKSGCKMEPMKIKNCPISQIPQCTCSAW